jgi:hypothetical protein
MKCVRVTKNLVEIALTKSLKTFTMFYVYILTRPPDNVFACLSTFFFTLEELKSSFYEYEHDEAAALPTTNGKRQKSRASLPCYHK